MTALVIAALSVVTWAYLLAARGGFWRAAQRDGPSPIARDVIEWPRVIAVVPARDEAEAIGANLRALSRQNYPGAFSVIVVDDHSADDTAAVVRRAAAAETPARVTVLAAPDLPDGWTGKLWALNHGIRHAESLPEPPDYLLLTDADIHHAPDTLTDLVGRARAKRLVLTSLMAKLHCESVVERALIPAFVFFFQMLYPFAWVNRPRRATAAAAGGCMLVHRQSLRKAGGIEAVRSELIDDCALARLLKKQGRIWIGLTGRVHSTRAYRSFGEIRCMIVRCAFTQLRFSTGLLAGATVAMFVVFVAPPVVALTDGGMARMLGVLAWACMVVAFQPTLRFYRVSPLWGLALPAIAAIYVVLTLDSAWLHLRGRGGEWKGRLRALNPVSRPDIRR
ncbi:MAG: glycosyltransferase [Pseudomonadota bacterium]|nr:glycosyltransferase [Pseudomonadota bacterium]